jgi:hypothetical protein
MLPKGDQLLHEPAERDASELVVPNRLHFRLGQIQQSRRLELFETAVREDIVDLLRQNRFGRQFFRIAKSETGENSTAVSSTSENLPRLGCLAT